jgi:hypothetical protein
MDMGWVARAASRTHAAHHTIPGAALSAYIISKFSTRVYQSTKIIRQYLSNQPFLYKNFHFAGTGLRHQSKKNPLRPATVFL